MKPTAQTISKVLLEFGENGGRFCISCEFAGARFHLWLTQSLAPDDDFVFKNPIIGATKGGPAAYRMQRLSQSKGVGAAIAALLIAAAPSLLPARLAEIQAELPEIQAENARRDRKLREAARQQLASDNAPELLRLLAALTTDVRTILDDSVSKRLFGDDPDKRHILASSINAAADRLQGNLEAAEALIAKATA